MSKALTKLSTAVHAPMPSASVRIATAVKPGDFTSWRSAKRKTQADFRHTLERGVRENAIESDGGKGQSETGENAEEKTKQALSAPGFAQPVEHRPHIENRLRRIDRAHDIADRFFERHQTGACANEKREAGALRLRLGAVNQRQRRHFIDGMKTHPPDHTNDLMQHI